MAKKKKKKIIPPGRAAAPVAISPRPLFSKPQWRAIGAGVLLIVSGFVLLSFTDPAGRNWQSTASPALLLLGYAVIGVALAARDKQDAEEDPDTPDARR